MTPPLRVQPPQGRQPRAKTAGPHPHRPPARLMPPVHAADSLGQRGGNSEVEGDPPGGLRVGECITEYPPGTYCIYCHGTATSATQLHTTSPDPSASPEALLPVPATLSPSTSSWAPRPGPPASSPASDIPAYYSHLLLPPETPQPPLLPQPPLPLPLLPRLLPQVWPGGRHLPPAGCT